MHFAPIWSYVHPPCLKTAIEKEYGISNGILQAGLCPARADIYHTVQLRWHQWPGPTRNNRPRWSRVPAEIPGEQEVCRRPAASRGDNQRQPAAARGDSQPERSASGLSGPIAPAWLPLSPRRGRQRFRRRWRPREKSPPSSGRPQCRCGKTPEGSPANREGRLKPSLASEGHGNPTPAAAQPSRAWRPTLRQGG